MEKLIIEKKKKTFENHVWAFMKKCRLSTYLCFSFYKYIVSISIETFRYIVDKKKKIISREYMLMIFL